MSVDIEGLKVIDASLKKRQFDRKPREFDLRQWTVAGGGRIEEPPAPQDKGDR